MHEEDAAEGGAVRRKVCAYGEKCEAEKGKTLISTVGAEVQVCVPESDL